MRNAFVSAFARSLEGSITLRDVKKNLDEIDPNKEPGKESDEKEEKSAAKKPAGPAGKV